MNRKAKSVIASIFKHILIYAVLLITLFPLLWMLLASFEPHQSIINQAAHGLFEFEPTLQNFVRVFAQYDFAEYTLNSFIVAAVATLLSLVIGLPCASRAFPSCCHGLPFSPSWACATHMPR